MRCTVMRTLEENDDLKQKPSLFWEIKNVNLFDECVINQLEKDIVFNGDRHVARFPIKEDHDLLADNFKTSEVRLKNFKKRKLIDQNILKEYNKIFKD